MPDIHSTAIVSPTAQLADDVVIGPYAVIGDQVTLGSGCEVKSHACIEGHTTMGESNVVFSHAVIGSPPQDKKFHGENVTLTIGNNNTFREFVTVNPGTEAGCGETRIGDNNLLLAYSHIAHDCIIHNGCVLSNGVQVAGHITMEDNVVVGGMTGFHQFSRIGQGAMVGGGSMVTLDVPPFCMASGNRAVLNGLNTIGLKRRGMDAEGLDALKLAYRRLFRQKRKLREVCTEMLQEKLTEPVQILVEFVDNTERGIVRPARER